MKIEDYALLGNCAGAGLVGLDGSIDWLVLPRFDSPACFAALLGTADNGCWKIAPDLPALAVRRAYRPGTLVLETRFDTGTGTLVLTDAMGRLEKKERLGFVIRHVRCERGTVAVNMRLMIRPEYGSLIPWVSRLDDGRIMAVAGPDRYTLAADVDLRGEGFGTVAAFSLAEGEERSFSLTWSPSYHPQPPLLDVPTTLQNITEDWCAWSQSQRRRVIGKYEDIVLRSLVTLKALTHYETGGIVAAPTTSLPESIGGSRNWDYRFCWLRDAAITLRALVASGYLEEAGAWRDWLVRAISGSPDDMKIMYGIAGERRFPEYELDWLPGYEGSSPVRVGNAASTQLQLDVYGEVVTALYQARAHGLTAHPVGYQLSKALLEHLAKIWREPDEGIWEVRGPRQQFTASKVMVWAAFDSAVKATEEFGLDGPLDTWRDIRDTVHRDVCEKGFNAELGYFTQHYGSSEVDATLLLMLIVGFLPADDPRILATIRAVEERLMEGGLVKRYVESGDVDGLGGGREGAFLACSFWLVMNYVAVGRRDEAETLFDRLVGLANDVGLLAEEYDPREKRQLGNFPQAFSHVALIVAAQALLKSSEASIQSRP